MGTLLIVCFGLTAVLAISDYLRHRSILRASLYAAALIIAPAGLLLTAYFSSQQRIPFGGAPPLLAVALMFGGVLLGIAATYIFTLKDAFSWRDFARPLVVSPLVLLPLIGSLQGAALEPIQLVCFTVLAFQNGFFWQQVLQDAKPKV